MVNNFTNNATAKVDNGKITLATGLKTENVKPGFTSGSSNTIDVVDNILSGSPDIR